MKKWIFSLITFSGIIACSPQIYHSLNWQGSQVKVDGAATEWKIPLKNYDSSLNLNYEFTNDSKNLYFAARTSKQSTIQQIMHGGLTIALDTLYSNSYPFSLTFPAMQGPGQMPGQNNMQQGDTPQTGSNQSFSGTNTPPQDMQSNNNSNFFQLPNNEITLKGFNGIEEDSLTVPFSGANGIYAQCFTDNEGILFYEVIIPFDTFYKPNISASDTTQVFSCCLSMQSGGGMPPQGGQNSGMGAPPSGGGMGGGMGGPPPGGMSGGPGGGMQGGPGMSSNQTSKSVQKIKMNFSLSFTE